VLTAVGIAGGILIAVSSYWVAAIPVFFRQPNRAVISALPISGLIPRLGFYLGLALLCLAWLQLGRLTLLRAPGTDWRAIRRISISWLVPISLSVPLGSRDLWAYAAQGQLVHHHLDPYTLGPSALPGSFAVEVSHRWVDSPAPYGPLWLLLGRGVAAVTDSVSVTVAILRLLAVLGVLLMIWALPTLAERAGGRADIALWIGVANPLVLVLGVGGGHNDMLMVGLMVAGLVFATGPGGIGRTLVLGTAIATTSVAIKSPSVVAVAFIVPLWLHHAPMARAHRSTRGVMVSTLIVAVVSIGVFAAITAISGLGLGWVKLVNSAAPIVNWMSIPTLLAICWNLAIGVWDGTTNVNATMRGFRSAGTVVTLILLTITWVRALRRDWWTMLVVALFVVVVLGPTVQPWYFCWGLAIAAVMTQQLRSLWLLAGGSIALVVMIRPNGTGLQMKPVVVLMIAGSLGLAWLILARRNSPAAQARPTSPA
jgi:alpha-1,6-mannosyltransferase